MRTEILPPLGARQLLNRVFYDAATDSSAPLGPTAEPARPGGDIVCDRRPAMEWSLGVADRRC